MTLKELRALDSEKLHEHLATIREKAREIRFGVTNRQVKNVRELRELRREIARACTVAREQKNVSNHNKA